MNMKELFKKHGLLASLIVVAVVFIVFVSYSFDDADAEKTKGFTQEPIQFEDFTFELLGSTSEGDHHTFNFKIVNTSDSAISVSKTFFKIKNGDKKFSSDERSVESRELNPGMSTLGNVTFIMQEKDLYEGKPKMNVEYGYVFEEVQQFELIINDK